MLTKLGLTVLMSGLSLTTSHAATITVVVPNANASVSGNTDQYGLFGEGASATTEFQWELAASQLAPLVGDSLTSIGFRLPAYAVGIPGSTTIGSFSLELSSAVNPIGALSTNFSSNIGPGGVNVYSGSLTLGPIQGLLMVNPFFTINFMRPYTYTGGNLVLTEVVLNASNFAVDANSVGDGIGDTDASIQGTPAATEYYNYPVTELIASTGTTAPEPSSVLMLVTGALVIGVRRFRRRPAPFGED